MPKSEIIPYLTNAIHILKDCDSLLYLKSEHNDAIKLNNLGRGVFVSAISLFAFLNYLSKVYLILCKGSKAVVGTDQIKEYNEISQLLKSKHPDEWKRIKMFMKKPREGEVNETKAFAHLITNCPLDLGIDKANSEQISNIWNNFRNKLTHIISLAGTDVTGQMLVDINFGNSNYKDNREWLISTLQKNPAFYIPTEETRKIFTPLTDMKMKTKLKILRDQCYVDRLNISCDQILKWLIDEVTNKDYNEDNVDCLLNWLHKGLLI